MIFALLAIFPLLTAALYSAGDAVITLSSRNFDKEVTDSESVWIVEFFAPWCGNELWVLALFDFGRRTLPETCS